MHSLVLVTVWYRIEENSFHSWLYDSLYNYNSIDFRQKKVTELKYKNGLRKIHLEIDLIINPKLSIIRLEAKADSRELRLHFISLSSFRGWKSWRLWSFGDLSPTLLWVPWWDHTTCPSGLNHPVSDLCCTARMKTLS